jgi:hypothetical protein
MIPIIIGSSLGPSRVPQNLGLDPREERGPIILGPDP